MCGGVEVCAITGELKLRLYTYRNYIKKTLILTN